MIEKGLPHTFAAGPHFIVLGKGALSTRKAWLQQNDACVPAGSQGLLIPYGGLDLADVGLAQQ